MVDISATRQKLRKQIEDMIFERRLQLTPLESGKLQFGYRIAGVNPEWAEVTAAHAQRLRIEIVAMQAIADELEEDGG